jgi:hypothetical protein
MAGVLMLGLWLGLIGLASSERLHHFLHSDSHQSNHECLVTFFSKGQLVGGLSSGILLVAVFTCLGSARVAEDGPGSLTDVRLAPSRAPPRFFFLPISGLQPQG